MHNINTKSYWDKRFLTGDWEHKRGRDQTRKFAISQIKYLDISKDFTGTILDFGCGLGDSFPIYKKAFPKAKLIGLDISEEAIKKCQDTYGHLAEFISGDYNNVPEVDIIIASNVFEHLSNDKFTAEVLMKKSRQLNIIVPYNEQLLPDSEHINSYNISYFNNIGRYKYKIFSCKGWSQYGINLIYHLFLKNLLRPLFGKPMIERAKQIIYIFNS